MMIAKKLLACAAKDFGNTLFLSNWATTGAPTAQVGTIGATGVSVVTPGTLDLGGHFVNCWFAAPDSDDWVVDMYFDGPAPPAIDSANPPWLVWYDGSALYLSDDGVGWTHFAAVPAGTAGRNHLAMGRQSGQVQAWLNGVRFLGGPATSTSPRPPSGIDIRLSGSGSVGPVRVAKADIYGDSATIAVPVEPLGIV